MNKILIISALVFLLLQCTGKTPIDEGEYGEHSGEKEQKLNHSEGSDNEDIKFQYTVYSKNYELFAESDPFVVGEEAEILAHFTTLLDFDPLIEDSVKLVLEAGGKMVSQTLKEPWKKGIYLFHIKPVAAGNGQLKFILPVSNTLEELVATGVEVYGSQKDLYMAQQSHRVSEASGTTFTKEQSWKIDFATAFPVLENFGQVIKTVALVEPEQQKEILLPAKIPGIIDFSNGMLLAGRKVEKGELLLTVQTEDLASENMALKLNEARNNYEKARADYERHRELAEDRAISEKELLNSKNEYENTKLIYENLERNFNSEGQVVKSPMDGFISRILVENGEFVQTGQPLLNLSQTGMVLLHADIQQKYLPAMDNFNSANFRKMNDSRIYTLEELDGELISYGRFATGGSYLLPVDFRIENNGEFLPGSFIEIFIKTLHGKEVLTVPNSSLLEEQGVYFVFVQKTPELFEKREVITGGSDGLRTVIEKGLSRDERIIIRGAMLVKLSESTATLDAHSGHVH